MPRRDTFEVLGGGGPLGPHDLAVLAREAEVVASGIAQDVAPGAADAQVDLARGQRHGPRAIPVGHVLAAGQGVEQEPPRRVEHALDEDLAIRGEGQRGVETGLGAHGLRSISRSVAYFAKWLIS